MADFSGMRVLIMGLGLHGGGLESARYLAQHGALVTVTDLRDEKALAPSIEKLEPYAIRYVLGRHETTDFEKADFVVKNPGVRPDSPYLKAARRIETDISLFLAASPARLIAVTGSKGKSSTASALHWVLSRARDTALQGALRGKAALQSRAWLGGNITVSPLSFLDQLEKDDDVVLELSSWQLGDLRGRGLKPRVAVLTPIMADHQNYYGNMDAYVADKRVIYQGQDENDATIAGNDAWGKSFLNESKGRPLCYGDREMEPGASGGWLTGPQGPGLARFARDLPSAGIRAGEITEVVPAEVLVPGYHQKQNLLAGALALLDLGLPVDLVRESLATFPGIEHRLEFFHQARGLRFYNDTTATIPEAAAAAVAAFEGRGNVILVAGGSDKELDFSPLVTAAERAKEIILLAGTGSEKHKTLLAGRNIPFKGPFDALDAAVISLLENAQAGDIVVLSPGCASFGMFQNEFDRGAKWKEAVKRLV
ncbi:MAG: UDP-N-acetylmuramoyl-L-alanine--D-glutamate ligase [Treponema sp.]|jgi:UDP-N-acetylmuramoylalanine--D-glutamate ligase|nr:UDP-N-acetylmuramoyl-L-alanine--D-glutamate ligase [Treponema sp.]